MKHQFPENKDIFCNEKHTLEQIKEFVFLAKLVGLEIGEETLEDLMDENYPYLYWDWRDKVITQYANEGDFENDANTTVSFEEFKKLLSPIPSARLEIERLFATI